jgi:hypothetical protein
MNKFGSLFGAAILALASMPANAALMAFDKRADWVNAVSGNFVTEFFEKAEPNSLIIIFEKSGIESKVSDDLVNLNQVVPGQYRGSVKDTFNTWTFPDPVLGFFGDFGKLDSGSQLNVTIGDDRTDPEKNFELTENGGFGVLGESSADLFSTVHWSSVESQAFTIEMFFYTGTDSSPVPAPPALWLFGVGLLGLIGFNRRRKAV